jgi:hypothetical protein
LLLREKYNPAAYAPPWDGSDCIVYTAHRRKRLTTSGKRSARIGFPRAKFCPAKNLAHEKPGTRHDFIYDDYEGKNLRDL